MAIQFLRGNTQENDGYTGPAGSLTIDTELNNIRLHDGVTAGGFVIANIDSTGAIQAISGTEPISISGTTDNPVINIQQASSQQDGYMSSADKSKLEGIEAEAQVNTVEPSDLDSFETSTELDARDSANRDRSNHTGTQLASTISDFEEAVNAIAPDPTDFSKLKIAVIGDSLSAQNNLMQESWPEVLERNINNLGGSVEVANFAINGHSYYRASTVATHGSQTALEACISSSPDIVLVALGFNDTVSDVDGRSLTQVQGDASSLYSDLRSALPDATILYCSELAYDKDHSTPSTLTNKNVIPSQFTLRSSGILSGCYSSEILEDNSSSTVENNYSDWDALDSHTKGLTEVDGSFTMNYFRIGRLGCISVDGLHPTEMGMLLQGGYVLKGLISQTTLFDSLGDQDYPLWGDPDSVFDNALSWSGSDYVMGPTITVDHLNRYQGLTNSMPMNSWFLPHKTQFYLSSMTPAITSPFIWEVVNGPINETVYISVDGGAFSSSGINTSSNGIATTSAINPVGAGTFTFRYKAGNEVYGPYSISFSSASFGLAMGGTGATTAAGVRNNLGLGSLATQDEILVESPNTPSFQNGWGNAGGSYQTVRYWKDPFGVVHLEGAITGSSTSTVFTLPFGYRPSATLGFALPCSGEIAAALVYSSGNVDIGLYPGGTLFLDGITFLAD